MKVLMISSNFDEGLRIVMPIGVCCVASAMEMAGHKVRVLDLMFSKNHEKKVVDEICGFRPDVIGIGIRNLFSLKHNTVEKVRNEVVLPCKKYFSGPLVIGGSGVGIYGPELLSFLDIPFALVGDGEKAMTEFLHCLDNGLPLKDLDGLLRWENGKITVHNPPAVVNDLNSLPFSEDITRHIDITPYREQDAPIPIQTRRGCPLKCVYCCYNIIEGRTYRLRDPEAVADEIERIARDAGVDFFEFVDSTFNLPVNHTKSVIRAVARKGLELRLATSGLNPSGINEELVDLMIEAGVRNVKLTAETGCNAMLRSLGKNYVKRDIINAAELFHKKGISLTYSMLLGAPGENRVTLKETFDMIDQIAAEDDIFNITVGLWVVKGTPISERMIREYPDSGKDNFLPPILYPPSPTLSSPELSEIARDRSSEKKNYVINLR